MAKPLKIQVEPLSEQRWTRIERSLLARHEAELAAPQVAPAPPRDLRLAVFALIAAATALAALIIALGRGSFQQGLDPGQNPSHITTGSAASHLALPGLALDVKPESEVVVGPDTSQGLLIVVDRGGVTCDVAPRAVNAPLIVQAGGARVRVVGTRFTVSRSGESARVEVEHGVVEVSANGQTWRIGAGQAWPTAGKGLGAQRLDTAFTPAPSAAREAAMAPGSTSSTGRDLSAPQRARGVAAAASVEPEGPAQKTGASSQRTFEAAAELEAREPARAAALYQGLQSGGDVWAQNALFAHGRLEASRGNAALARGLLTQYLARFPRGTNADDARAVLGRLR